MPIDYSKWKTIEVSDDEDDTHPNIDTPSLFRWRHQARVERMAEIEEAKKEVETGKKKTLTRMQEIEEKLKDTSLEDKERIKLELEKQKIKDDEDKFRAKERELEEKERLQPWNVDTIGHEAWSKSIINKAADKKKTAEPAKVDEEEDSKRMTKYFQENESLLQKYALLDGFDKCEEFLLEHPQLASDYAASYITIEALNLAIEYKEDEMEKYAANCITLQYLLELAKTLNALATNTNVIKNFFKKIKAADVAYMKMYYDEVEAFKDRLRKRAQTKREEALQEYEAEEKAKRVAQAPGGLDPQEVYDALPVEMQEAFSSQDMQKLFGVAESMDPEVFQYHLQRCIDSGLWIPNAKEAEEKEKAGAAAAQKSTAAAADKTE